MKIIKESTNFILYGGFLGIRYPVYYIQDLKDESLSKLFTKEVADNLSSLDLATFDAECSELMKVEDFHIQREFTNAD